MSQRFFVYPLLFVAAMQLVPLLRRDARWHAAQIAQLTLILLASFGALFFVDDFIWVVIAWTLFCAFIVAPRFLGRLAARQQSMGRWMCASRLWNVSGRLTFGHLGRLHRVYAAALQRVAENRQHEAEELLDRHADKLMLEPMRGIVRLWRLTLLHGCRDWQRAVDFYESIEDWGALSVAMRARLLAARSFAETGQVERALRSLQLVALSPRTIGAMEQQLWATRVCVAALAGDVRGLDELLQRREQMMRGRGFARFATYWRGRCALARGDRAEAMRQLERAQVLTPPRNQLWRDAIAQQLQKAETGKLPASFVAQNPSYAHGWEVLQMAEQQAARWHALMRLGQPARVTLALLLVIATVYLVDETVFTNWLQMPLWWWAGNGAETLHDGEWWRLVTTLFLHANPLHLAMNGVALWIFGSAVENTMGRWQFLAVFFLAGMLGNFLSALHVRYDVAVGASGGIFGIVGAYAVAVYRLDGPMYTAVRKRLLLLLALMVAGDFSIGWLEPQVDNLAHVGGFFAGIALAAMLYRPRRVAHGHVRRRAVDAVRSV
jgi:membrane associated rhomboid family serine protease